MRLKDTNYTQNGSDTYKPICLGTMSTYPKEVLVRTNGIKISITRKYKPGPERSAFQRCTIDFQMQPLLNQTNGSIKTFVSSPRLHYKTSQSVPLPRSLNYVIGQHCKECFKFLSSSERTYKEHSKL